jgi:hypothetical protein
VIHDWLDVLQRAADNDGVVAVQTRFACKCEARGTGSKLKKRHVERMTRLPTKRMATACWAFIVAKSTPPETAPLLDFSSLQAANSKIYTQDIHKNLWTACG